MMHSPYLEQQLVSITDEPKVNYAQEWTQKLAADHGPTYTNVLAMRHDRLLMELLNQVAQIGLHLEVMLAQPGGQHGKLACLGELHPCSSRACHVHLEASRETSTPALIARGMSQ